MKVQVEGLPLEDPFARHLRMPGRKEPHRLPVIDLARVLRQEALLRHDVQAAEQAETPIGEKSHDVALAFDRPKLERQLGTKGVAPGSCENPEAWHRVPLHRGRD